MDLLGQKKQETPPETQEQLKILATNLEILNQRISDTKGGSGGEVNVNKLQQFVDYQHNFIVTTINQKEQSIVRTLTNNIDNLQKTLVKAITAAGTSPATTAPATTSKLEDNAKKQQEAAAAAHQQQQSTAAQVKAMQAAFEDFKNTTIAEIQKNNALNQLDKMQKTIVGEVQQYRDVNIALDKKITVLLDLLKQTIVILKHQNELLQKA